MTARAVAAHSWSPPDGSASGRPCSSVARAAGFVRTGCPSNSGRARPPGDYGASLRGSCPALSREHTEMVVGFAPGTVRLPAAVGNLTQIDSPLVRKELLGDDGRGGCSVMVGAVRQRRRRAVAASVPRLSTRDERRARSPGGAVAIAEDGETHPECPHSVAKEHSYGERASGLSQVVARGATRIVLHRAQTTAVSRSGRPVRFVRR